jgi:hypothetical protein
MPIGRLTARVARAKRPTPNRVGNPSDTPHSLFLSRSRGGGSKLVEEAAPAGAPPATATRTRGGGSPFSSFPSAPFSPAAGGLCRARAGNAPRQWTAARPSAPEGGLSLSAVVEASSSTARVLRLVLRLPDTHRDREERARPETAAHYSGEPEASPVSSFFSPFPLFSF